MKRILLIVSIISLISSCKEEEHPEVITFEELVGDTGAPTEAQGPDSEAIPSDGSAFNLFTQGQLGLYDTFPHKKVHVLDRFGYSNQTKLDFKGKNKVPYGKTEMVIPTASVYYYTFSDSVKTKSAFYNWLDCYGTACNEVKLLQDANAIESSPMFTLVYDTTIVAVEYSCEHEKNDWNQFEDSLISQFGKNYKYRIEVGCGGNLRWKK